MIFETSESTTELLFGPTQLSVSSFLEIVGMCYDSLRNGWLGTYLVTYLAAFFPI